MIEGYLDKANWIANKLNMDGDDVYDALLGNITKPQGFVDEVNAAAEQYDSEVQRELDKIRSRKA